MLRDMKTIKDVYGNNWKSMIFDKLSNIPWDTTKYSSDTLNMLYQVHSDRKYVGNIITSNMEGDKLTEEEKQTIADSISVMFMDNWRYIYDALLAEYNPIYNYNMIEKETINETGNGSEDEDTTLNKTLSSSDNSTAKDSGTVKNESKDGGTVKNDSSDSSESNSTTNNKVFGYNSEEAVKDSEQSSTESDSSTGTSTETRALTGENTETRALDTETNASHSENGSDITDRNKTYSDNKDTKRDLTREGNIGVTTSQQMIESELHLRMNKYFEIVFTDIDSLITLPLFSVM